MVSACSSARPMRMVSIRFIGTSPNSGGAIASTISPSGFCCAMRHLPLRGAREAVHRRIIGLPCLAKYGQQTGMPPRIGSGGRLVMGDSQSTSSNPCGVHDSTWPPEQADGGARERRAHQQRGQAPEIRPSGGRGMVAVMRVQLFM